MSHPHPTTPRDQGRSGPQGEPDPLDLLPRSYRSWVSGAVRVFVALTLTVAAGLLLRSFPEGQSSAAAATRGTTVGARALTAATTPRPQRTVPVSARPAVPASAVAVLTLPLAPSAPDLRLRLISPSGIGTAVAGRPVDLRAELSDVTGGVPAAADLIWEVTRVDGHAVPFLAHGPDAELPAAAAAPGRYRVTVVARSGIARAEAATTLVIAPRTR